MEWEHCLGLRGKFISWPLKQQKNFSVAKFIHSIIFTEHHLCARPWGHSTENNQVPTSWGVLFPWRIIDNKIFHKI